ncbi:hypothetical protein BX616_011123 [Lobosporangium transversale]|nr:hypothetical protein BX616_011123 [Lobosporangium transversale]
MTFQHAYQFALHYPTRTVLVLLSDNIRPTFRTRIMQWMHKILTAQMQQLWSREALKAVPASLRGLSTSSSLPVGSTLPRRPIDFTLDKARPLDLSLLPPNLCIGSKICAAKLLIDKPFNTQSIAASVTNSCTNTPPSAPPRPGPFKRFSSTAGSNLTINTMPLMPPRIVGLEVVASGGPQDKRCRVLCNDSVVFASDKHPLLSSANAMIFTINTTPPTSRDTGVTGHSALLLDTESRLQWPSMIFSITMQHRRQQQDPKLILIHSSSSSIQYRILKAALCFLERISGVRAAYSTQHSFPEKGVNLQPVLLHCSDRVIQNGRVNIREQGDVNSDEVLRLQISASTISLEPSAPIQIEVKVVTQPMQQDAFGNTEMIRKGESVLMEGLGLARQMAKTAGWTCLAEDDSQMVEWVRDQMDIQWSTETASSFSSSNAFILRPLSISLNGLNTFVRSRTASSASSTRTRPSSLSPYASRTQSYKIKRREELGPGMGDKRDSTLERLQKVSANLQTTTQGKEKLDETHLKAPKATIAATKGSLSTSSSPPQRPGLKTSFGGFSSLNDTRMQTLALAEQTEDHLGMALSSGATNSPKKRSSADQNSDSGNGPFSESVAPLDLLGAENQKPVSPTPHKWSRFSIKSYQLERSNYGLSNEWAIGSEGLDMSLSSVPSVSTAVGAILSSSPTSTLISASSSGELISSLPLSSEGGFLGTVSPQTPTPDNLPMTDLLKNMDVSSPPSISPSPSRPKLFDRNTNYNKQSGSADDKGIDDQLSSGKLGSSSLIDSNSRKGGTFTSRCGGGGVTSFGKGGSHHPSPLTTPVELVHDFLGESFTSSTSISKPALFSRPLSRNDLALTMERVQSAPTVPKSSSSLSSSSTTKTVNFADIEQQEQQKDDRLLRAHSDPIVRTTTLCLDDSLSLESDKTHSPLYSMQSSFSKSKAHTRRSWGQGIGGYDIQGLQGLS